jgi:hypothetical protein
MYMHVVFMVRYVMILRWAIFIEGHYKGVGPEIETFLGPEMATNAASVI